MWRFLSSIRLAVPLLAIIVMVLIGATFYESQVGSTTVQQQIYKSPWFGALMFLLALNLGASALSRYPWVGLRKMGFALTHLGLIIIIMGSAAVIHFGVEGMLLLHSDRAASNQIRIEGDLLEVMRPDGTIERANFWVKDDGSVQPKSFAGLSLLRYSESTQTTVGFSEGATVENLALGLNLHSQRLGQTLVRWLAVAPPGYHQMSLGPATLELIQVRTPEELQRLLQPPEAGNTDPWGELEMMAGRQKWHADVEKMLRGDRVAVGDSITVSAIAAFPDFRLNGKGQPTTASEAFNNPAVQLEITSPTGSERWFVFGRAEFPPVRTLLSGEASQGLEIQYRVTSPQPQAYFKAIATASGELFYTAQSSQGFKSGPLTLGESIAPGWADFEITLEEIIPHARIEREIIPLENPTLEGIPALLVETEAGTQTWLPWGEPTTLEAANGEQFAAYGPKLLHLPFAVKLEDFIVERNEGSDSVAMWTSQIRIEDANGTVEQRRVWMNHPTWYRGWKIAQASWNPGDLQQSTLQVKREPAWVTALTWTGSGLVVAGIGILFYGPGIARKLRRLRPEPGVKLTHPPQTDRLIFVKRGQDGTDSCPTPE
jgi:hypothetical protein